MSAVPAPDTGPDAGAVWHYGDPFGEQRAGQTGAIVVDRSHRSVIALTGGDRQSWLHNISTQHVSALADGTSTENLSLDGQGRVEDHWIQTELDGVTYLDTESWRGEPLLAYLRQMVFWSEVTIEQADLAVLSLIGPRLGDRELLAPLGLSTLPDPMTAVALPGGGFVRRNDTGSDDAERGTSEEEERRNDTGGDDAERGTSEEEERRNDTGAGRPGEQIELDLLVPRAATEDWLRRLEQAGAHRAGVWAYEAHRVAAHRPRLGVDTDERTIPHEVGWIPSAVHLDKGCYRGQETVARVHNLGKPPRMLVLLHLDGSADRPATGDPVLAGGRAVGRLGTVVDHVDLGPVALALLKRALPADTELTTGGEYQVAAMIDADSLPPSAAAGAGRLAVDRLRDISR